MIKQTHFEDHPLLQSLFSLLKGVFWRYLACWSSLGFVIYFFISMGIAMNFFEWKGLGTLLLTLFMMTSLYLVSLPIILFFHWTLYKIRQQKTNSKLDFLILLIGVGLFVYPFLIRLFSGNVSSLHNSEFLTKPDDVFVMLLGIVIFCIVFLISSPLKALFVALIFLSLFKITNKWFPIKKLPRMPTTINGKPIPPAQQEKIRPFSKHGSNKKKA